MESLPLDSWEIISDLLSWKDRVHLFQLSSVIRKETRPLRLRALAFHLGREWRRRPLHRIWARPGVILVVALGRPVSDVLADLVSFFRRRPVVSTTRPQKWSSLSYDQLTSEPPQNSLIIIDQYIPRPWERLFDVSYRLLPRAHQEGWTIVILATDLEASQLGPPFQPQLTSVWANFATETEGELLWTNFFPEMDREEFFWKSQRDRGWIGKRIPRCRSPASLSPTAGRSRRTVSLPVQLHLTLESDSN